MSEESKKKLPQVLEEAHKAFKRAVGPDNILWPDQNTAYCAGYMTAIAKIKSPRAHLKYPSKWETGKFRALCRTTRARRLVLTDIVEDVNCLKCLAEIMKKEKG